MLEPSSLYPLINMNTAYAKLTAPTGALEFARLAAITHKKWQFKSGSIYLQKGTENWGAQHIQRFHAHEFKNMSVEQFVHIILRSGTPVYCEFEAMRERQKLLAVNSKSGTAVLAWVSGQEDGFYTVITAFARKQSIGERVGKIE